MNGTAARSAPSMSPSTSTGKQQQQQQPPDSGVNGAAPASAQITLDGPNERVDVLEHAGGRILCVADIRGRISKLNDLAREHQAIAIIHTGDFGFYDHDSIERISDRTLRHLVQYSQLIEPAVREKHFPMSPPSQALSLGQLRDKLLNPSPELLQDQKGVEFILSEFPKLLKGDIKLEVPVYTVWGACEDIAILEKIRAAPTSPISTKGAAAPAAPNASQYSIPNLTVLSEGVTRCVVIGGVKLRMFGLGGSVVPHKFFDNGEGTATMAGGNGTMWTTALQIGELLDTAQKVFDQTETRLLITHASPGREGLLAQVALAIKADFTLSGSLHFRNGTSYNDFSVHTDTDSYRGKFNLANRTFMEVYDSVKTQVEAVIDDQQKYLLKNALGIASRIPQENVEEAAWKNSWNWNLPDALYGSLILDIKDGRVGSELKSTGFNFAYRLKNTAPAPINAQSNRGPHGANRPGYQSRQVSNASPANAPSPSSTPGPSGNAQRSGPPSTDAFASAANNAFRGGFGRSGHAYAGGNYGSGGRGRGAANMAQHVVGAHRPRDAPSPAPSTSANNDATASTAPAASADRAVQDSTAESTQASTSKTTETKTDDASDKAVPGDKPSVEPSSTEAAPGENASRTPRAAASTEGQRKSFFPPRGSGNGWRDREASRNAAATAATSTDSPAESSGGEAGQPRGEGFQRGRGGFRGGRGPPRGASFSSATPGSNPEGGAPHGRGAGGERGFDRGSFRGRGRGSDRGRGGRGSFHRTASSGEGQTQTSEKPASPAPAAASSKPAESST